MRGGGKAGFQERQNSERREGDEAARLDSLMARKHKKLILTLQLLKKDVECQILQLSFMQ